MPKRNTPVSRREVDHRQAALDRGEVPFDPDSAKHTGIQLDTSKLTDDEVQSNPLYWRERMRRARGIAFDDVAKAGFLEALRLHGNLAKTCEATGVHRRTVLRHREKDEEFEAGYDAALELHSMDKVAHLEEQALEGFENDVYNMKTGDIIGTKRTYETALRVAVLKAYGGEQYTDRSKIDANVKSTGKMLAIPSTATPEEFDAMLDQLAADQAQIVKDREEQDRKDAAEHQRS